MGILSLFNPVHYCALLFTKREKISLMAARREISQRKTALIRDLREAHRSGLLAPGDMAPSVRDLALKYELSMGVVAQQLQVLEQEGLLYKIPRAGTFIGQPRVESSEFYLFILPGTRRDQEIETGFEEEIAKRGGTPLVVTREQAKEQLSLGAMPPLAGVFYYWARQTEGIIEQINDLNSGTLAECNFVDFSPESSPEDKVGFDNVGGGRQATQYLLEKGHKRVAYLGVHGADDKRWTQWSVDRMEGWQIALERANTDLKNLAFLPSSSAARIVPSSPQLLQEAARRLLRESRVTAVVTANDEAALQLIQTCREEGIPASQWPAIVSFDDSLSTQRNRLTSLRLPWEALGRTAATLLWERRHGQLDASPVSRLIPLRIITRLSCRGHWSLAESLQPVSLPSVNSGVL